jgi:Icc-related predicted phosphoesterase
VEQYHPPLTLHGHIHEGPVVSGVWLEHIGTTVAINPGQAQRGFHAVVLDTDNIMATAWHTVYGSYDPTFSI